MHIIYWKTFVGLSKNSDLIAMLMRRVLFGKKGKPKRRGLNCVKESCHDISYFPGCLAKCTEWTE